MEQIITGLIILAVGVALYKGRNHLAGLGFGFVGLFLIWPGSGHLVSVLFGQLLNLLYYLGPVVGLVIAAVCGLRLMMGLPALPRRLKRF